MSADEMFEDLGYKVYLNNEDTLLYKKQSDFFKTSITFDKREFKKSFYAIDADKYCSANGYWSTIWHEFSIEELQAINKKVEELGWK